MGSYLYLTKKLHLGQKKILSVRNVQRRKIPRDSFPTVLICPQHLFGGDVKLSKEPITELYKNLSLETPSGQQKIEFEKISDLTANISFKVKHCILSKLEKQDKRNAGNNKTHKFFKKLIEEKEF